MSSLIAAKMQTVVLSASDTWIFGISFQNIVDAVITLIAMFVLFLILSYLIFNPARNLMEKRQARIQGDLDTAAQDKADAAVMKEEYDARLQAVRKESEEILSDTRKRAVKKESEIVEEAKAEASRITEHARKEAELEKNRVNDQIKKEMIGVAMDVAGKFVAVSIDEQKQQELVEDTMKEMSEKTWQN